MPGKLEVTGSTAISSPKTVTAYCEGRNYKKAGKTITYATGVSGAVASNNSLAFTAVTPGDGLTVHLVDPLGNSKALAVAVKSPSEIVVSLATGSGGAITSTAAQVDTAIGALTAANAMVGVANNGASTGAGVVIAQSVQLKGCVPTGLQFGSEQGVAFKAGFDSWAASSGGPTEGRDPCAEAYGGGAA